jgi:hypothetical protein
MKAWYKSKTVWFNILSGILPVMEAQFAFFAPYFGEMAVQLYITAIIMGNIALRFVTVTKIGDHDE